MRLLIDSGHGFVDYTQYVVDGSISVEDSINVPTLLTFQLQPTRNSFVIPTRSCYVKLVSEIFAEPTFVPAAPRNPLLQSGDDINSSGKVLFSGFITNSPDVEFLGLNQNLPSLNYQQNNYTFKATSEEWLLNSQAVPYIPAFVNQTDSQILAAIANTLMPGYFDTTSCMASGTLVPYYQYDPTQTWSDIAKTFADANRYYYKVKNKKIYYQPFGTTPPAMNTTAGLGISYDESTQKESQLYPTNFKSNVVTVPPVNDCIVIGDTEPQTNWDNYFVGDGFTSNFQLRHQVFQGTSSQLLSDDWSESAFQSGVWIVNDPRGVITLTDSNGNAVGALNIIQKGASGVYTPQVNATFIQAQNGLELGGGINLQHGQFTFNDTASGGGGIIGGVYPTSVFNPGNVLCGFAITGQPASNSHSVSGVQINAGSDLITFTLSDLASELLIGQVLQCRSFVNASFLNGLKLTVQTIQLYPSTGHTSASTVITCLGSTVYNSGYGPAGESTAQVQAFASDIITSASGCAGIAIQPIFSGGLIGVPVISQINHQYVLQTWIGAGAPTRYTRPYTNLTQTNTYGNQNLASSGSITWVITDVNIANYVVEQQFPLFGLFPATTPPVVTKYTQTNVTLPPFALYCLANAIMLNLSINYTNLSLPPQGYLTVQSLTGASGGSLPWLPSQLSIPIVYQLGFGMVNQTAQISQQGEAYALSFYTDDIPSVGARIRFQSWAAGQSIARVQDPGAIATEAKVSGDTGIRSAILSNLSPIPRTSAECEAAAAAALLDREYPQFQGSYTVQTQPYSYELLFNTRNYDYPHTGMFFYVNALSRGISGQNFFVNTVRTQVVEIRQESLMISVDYGPDTYLEKQLPSFLEREQNILTPTQTVPPPNPITLPQVLNAALPTFDNAQVIAINNTLNGNTITVDLSGGAEANAATVGNVIASIGATGCEVRYVDNGWGIANSGRVGIFTTDQFTLPRTIRDQTYYIRGIKGSIFSKYSKALRVNVPLIPSSPIVNSVSPQTIALQLNGDVRDIYGLELRAVLPPSGAFYYQLPPNPVTGLPYSDQICYFSRQALPTTPPYNWNGNTAAVFSPASNLPPTSYVPQLGDILYNTCPLDGSFAGIKLVTGIGLASFAASGFVTISPTAASGDVTTDPTATFDFWQPYYAMDGIQTTASTTSDSFVVGVGGPVVDGVDYSIDGGHTWVQAYQQTITNGTSTFTWIPMSVYINLPVGTNCANVMIRARHKNGTNPQFTAYWYGFPSKLSVAGDQIGIIGGINYYTSYSSYFNETFLNAVFEIDELFIQTGATSLFQVVQWFDYGQPYPDTKGQQYPGSTYNAGQIQLYGSTSYNGVISGSITGQIATLKTSQPHGYVIGSSIINSCGWYPPAPSNVIAQDGAPVCGQFTVTGVVDDHTFQITLQNWTRGNVGNVGMIGATAALPSASAVGASINGISGIILQRPVFSPSDLIIDLTQPPVSTQLGVIEALTPGGRVLGLNVYFFNLTWDYSAPTPIPEFTVPQISGVIIDFQAQNIVWSVASGIPRGHRIESYDSTTGVLLSKYTVDHPNNPQVLTRSSMTAADWLSARRFKIIPFDGLGDGVPYTIDWGGSSGSPVIGSGLPAGLPGDIVRYNVKNDNAWDAVSYPALFDGVSAWTQVNVGIAFGFGGGTVPIGMGAAASWTGHDPTPSVPYYTTTSSYGTASPNVVIGVHHWQTGNSGAINVKMFYRMQHKLAISPVNNTRYWWGLFVYANGSALGQNGTNYVNSSQLCTDTPNRTIVGWRWSQGTDTNFKAVVIQAGGSSYILDTGVPADSSQHVFDVTLDAAFTYYTFYIDGVQVAQVSASVIAFNPINPLDVYASMLYTGDNKNNTAAVAITFGSMLISLRN